ncbi:MAG: LamG domain-containing protein, partial [bacterium]|nr:LamG domain-containing protein [bacterium]
SPNTGNVRARVLQDGITGYVDPNNGSALNQEYHYAITWVETAGVVTIKGYLDGTLIDTDTGPPSASVGALHIGGSNGNSGANGIYGDFRIYDTALSDAEVAVIATPGPDAILVLKIGQSGGTLDFEWNSLDGMQYDLLSSTDLTTDPATTWLPYNDGVNPAYEDIPATGTTTTLSGVLQVGPTRFFVLIEEPIPPLLEENFDSGDGSFTVATDSGTPWAHGGPDSSGAGGDVTTGNGDSPKCWATNLGTYAGGAGDEGFFADSTVTRLRS